MRCERLNMRDYERNEEKQNKTSRNKTAAMRIVQHIVSLKIGEQLKRRIFQLAQLCSATTILLIYRDQEAANMFQA